MKTTLILVLLVFTLVLFGCSATITGETVKDIKVEQKEVTSKEQATVEETSEPGLEYFNVDTIESKCGFRYDGKVTWIDAETQANVGGRSITVVGLAGTSCIATIDGQDHLLELGQEIN